MIKWFCKCLWMPNKQNGRNIWVQYHWRLVPVTNYTLYFLMSGHRPKVPFGCIFPVPQGERESVLSMRLQELLKQNPLGEMTTGDWKGKSWRDKSGVRCSDSGSTESRPIRFSMGWWIYTVVEVIWFTTPCALMQQDNAMCASDVSDQLCPLCDC